MNIMKISDYKTLTEWISEHPDENIFSGMDNATRTLVYNHFEFRRVNDNDRFGKYFKRTYREIESQYMSYLKIEKIDINPLLTQIEAMSTAASQINSTTTSTKQTGDNTQTINNKSDVSASVIGAGRIDNSVITDVTTESDSTVAGTSTETRDTETIVNNTVGTNTSTNVEGSNTTNVDGTDSTHNTSLNGNLPQSSAYTTDFDIKTNALSWKYASNQSEGFTANTTDNETITSSNEETTGTIDTVTSGTTVVDDGGTTNTNTSSSLDVKENTETVGITQSSDNKTTSINKEDDGTIINTNNGTTETTKTDEVCNKNYTNKEVQGEAAQDLLKRAISYITNTNAIQWLFDELEICFLMIYE